MSRLLSSFLGGPVLGLLATVLCCLEAPLSHAADYEVDGTIEQTIVTFNGGPPARFKSDFTVYVKDCAWLVQTRPAGSTNTVTGVFEVASTNGTDIFQVDIRRLGTNAAKRALNIAQAYANAAPVDFLDGGMVGHLWLMFASGCALATNTDNLLPPVYDVSAAAPGKNTELKREIKWEPLRGAGSTPLSLVFLTNPIRKTTNASYMATGQTNVGSVTVASGFIFNQYLGGSDRIRKTATCTVTALRPHCSLENLLPNPKGPTVVGDLRVRIRAEGTNAPPTVVYEYKTDAGWLSPEASKKQYLEDRKRLLAMTHRSEVSPAVIVLLMALLMAPVVWFVFKPKSKAGLDSKGASRGRKKR